MKYTIIYAIQNDGFNTIEKELENNEAFEFYRNIPKSTRDNIVYKFLCNTQAEIDKAHSDLMLVRMYSSLPSF